MEKGPKLDDTEKWRLNDEKVREIAFGKKNVDEDIRIQRAKEVKSTKRSAEMQKR